MSDRPWHQNYPVRKTLEYPEVSLYDFLKQTTSQYSDLVSLVFMGNEITYQQMFENIDRFASALIDLGVKKGDRVALMLPNSPQYVYAYYACMKLGAIVVQVNPLYTSSEVEFIVKDSGAKVFIGVDAVFGAFQAIRDKVSVAHVIVARMLWMDVEGENLFFEELLQKYPPDSPTTQINPQEDIAVFQYTGGTTGFPKAAMLTHFNLVSNVVQTQEWIAEWKNKRFGDKIEQFYGVAVLPFFHSFGMTVTMNAGLTMPVGQVLVPRFDIDVILEVIKRYKPVMFPAIPTIYTAIINHPQVNDYNIDAVEICVSGAAPMPVELIKRFEKLTGSTILEGYGLSESSPITHVNPLLGTRKAGSIGLPYPDTDCKIVDIETGTREVAPGEEGELIIKGPQIMKGYWNRLEETALTLRDGWLFTGDIASMDDEGYFYIVDRKKDMVISKGYNVYPREVDEVLFEHPKVMEAVTAGIRDDYEGEILKAYVVLKDGETATEKEILEYCATKLAKYKIPKKLEFRTELPKSSVGKILRRELVAQEKKGQQEK